MREKPQTAGSAALVMVALLGMLWGVELLDQLSGDRLDNLGIHARTLAGLAEIFAAPFLHAGWGHLVSNSAPFLVLGFLVLLGGLLRWVVSTLISILSSGLAAWLLSPVNTVVIGASGLIFGWLTYLLARAIYSRKPGQIVVAMVVLLVYGSMIWGVLPGAAGISWQAHLGGAVGGVVAARVLHRGAARRGQSASARAAAARW